MEVLGMKRSMVLLVAVILLVGVYVTKQALAWCFHYCVVTDWLRVVKDCGGVIEGCPGFCYAYYWQQGSCEFTINPFAGCESVHRYVPYSVYSTNCVSAGQIFPNCQCDETNWQFEDIGFVYQSDCNGYTCFGY